MFMEKLSGRISGIAATSCLLAFASMSQPVGAVTTPFESIDSPSFAVFNGRLFMSYTGTDSNHRLNYAVSDDGVNFSNPAVDPAQRSSTGVAIATFNGLMYTAWTGASNHQIALATSVDGLHYTGAHVINPLWNSPWRVSMASGGGFIYLGWLGFDSNIYVIRSPDGVSWSMYTSIKHINLGGGDVGPVWPPTLATDGSGNAHMVYTSRGGVDPTTHRPIYSIGHQGLGGSASLFPICRNIAGAAGMQAGLGFAPEILVPWYPGFVPGGGTIALDVNGGSCLGGTTYPTSGSPMNGSDYGLTGVAPAAYGFNGHAYIAFTGTDSAQHINIIQVF